MLDPKALLASSANLRAYLRMLRYCEHSPRSNDDDYRRIVGGSLFIDFADHPRTYIAQFNSTAAGAYQIIKRTWDSLVKQHPMLTSFEPDMQDCAAVFLIDGRNALADVLAGRWVNAVVKCQAEWASLPGANALLPDGSPQHMQSWDRLKVWYLRAGGTEEEV